MQEYILCERRYVGASVRCQFILCRRLDFYYEFSIDPCLFNESWNVNECGKWVVKGANSLPMKRRSALGQKPEVAMRIHQSAVTIVGMAAMFSSDNDYRGRQSRHSGEE